METKNGLSRRNLLAALTAAGAASRAKQALAAAAGDKANVPVISKQVEKLFLGPGKEPNALQCVSDGLWILDQEDPNKVHKVRYEDGSVMVELQTESYHGSGITYGNGALWIASTGKLKTLKVDPATGKTLKSFDTPGVGPIKWGKDHHVSGAHGMEWVDGKYWIAVPPSVVIYLIEPETGQIIRSIPAPGVRPHGLAWDNGYLWCVESNDRAIYKLDPKDGRPVAKIQLTRQDPEPHGLSIRDGVLWYSDASSRWISKLV
jgi:streptogramin lyase